MANNKQNALLNSPVMNKLRTQVLPLAYRNKDLLLAVGILMILALLIIPLPPVILDLFLALNLAMSVLILLISVYIRSPLEFSAFPAVLLMTTLFRLGLNVATTRLILGDASAGEIVHAFGSFVIKGNYVVGIIIFLILLVINFIVVIKGSTRIAEVSARFTLDALPGKQMSIDADLNAGYIDEQTARKRREDLSRETDFFGSMDGAAKFIKGDAIAGLIITAVNIIGGLTIGVLQLGMSFSDAASTYTILTIGDGLIAQIPSLLISVAAGLVVTRSSGSDKFDVELAAQFGEKAKPLALTAGALIFIGLLPGFPFFPFFLLAAMSGSMAYYRIQKNKRLSNEQIATELQSVEEKQKPEEAPVEDLLKIDPVEIELGYALIQLVDETQGGDVFKRITNVRRQLATELGIVLPPVRVRDNLQLEPEEYVVKIRANELAKNRLYPNMLLAMNPGNADGKINGIDVTEPVFGLPATWVNANERENAEVMGFTVVEAATVLTTHLTELLRRNADKLLTRQEVRHLIDTLKTDYPALIDEIQTESLPVSTVQKVLQNLLSESIPIRDLPIILEGLLEYHKITKNIDVLTEYVRHNLSETIKKLYQDQNGVIHGIALDPVIEDRITNALQVQGTSGISPTLGLSPEVIDNIRRGLSDAIDEISLAGYMPIIICSAQIRPYIYRMIHNTFPLVNVISFTELPADTDIEIHGQVRV